MNERNKVVSGSNAECCNYYGARKHGQARRRAKPSRLYWLMLLSLDGGGVRGLSSLYILKSIMDRLNHVRGQNKLHRVKPCEVFDLIGGTSTGG
ncbi:hypothetical protein PHISCL_04224 [Aspergillus sclerotialis]|uniref:PNPLA domain-containing protein n=1 Tax=Aspergillus sclerotialis TaxID=2070753 RepID=A0A3A2ZK43_9EURO|nr:hypothetical protein PHISCL_04224 [Aspergillus sclerotialis]